MAAKIPIPPSGLKRLILLPNQTHIPETIDQEPLPPPEPPPEPMEGQTDIVPGPFKIAEVTDAPLGLGAFGYTYTALPPLTNGTSGLIDNSTNNTQQKANFSSLWNYLAALFGTSGTPTEALASLTAGGGIGVAGGSTTGPVNIGKGVSYINGADLATAINSSSVCLQKRWLVSNAMVINDYVYRRVAGTDWQSTFWGKQWAVDSTVMASFSIDPFTGGGTTFTWSNGNGTVAMSFDTTLKTLTAPKMQSVGAGSDSASHVFHTTSINISQVLMDRSSGLFGFHNITANRWRGYFDASENFVAAGNVSGFSDSRLKENVTTIDPDEALEVVKSMRAVRFRRKDTGQDGMGYIAQELTELLPEVVLKNSEGIHSLAYGNLAAIHTPAIQALIKQNEEMRKELDELREAVSRLQREGG